MGTNFYFEKEPPCCRCGRGYEMRHIGKSSAGWCFSLHVDDFIKSLDDMVKAWQGKKIVDECGEEIPEADMLRRIKDRSWERKGPADPGWYHRNEAIPGPNGLARRAIDGRHCVGHGEGTWDLITGEFS